jgi:hypothetical protein
MGTEEEMGRKSIARMQEEMIGDEEAGSSLDDVSVSRGIREGVWGDGKEVWKRGKSLPSTSQGNFESLFLNSSVVDELELELLDDQSRSVGVCFVCSSPFRSLPRLPKW